MVELVKLDLTSDSADSDSDDSDSGFRESDLGSLDSSNFLKTESDEHQV